MPQNWNIDPQKKDYVMQGGAPQQTDSLQIPAYIRLKTNRTQWLYAPDTNYGSDLYTVQRNRTTSDPSFLEAIAAKALQPIVDDGRASQITVTTVTDFRNAVGLQTTILDAQGTPEEFLINGTGV